MNAPWNRTFAYLFGGGLVLTWLEPTDGAFRVLAIGGLIVAMAYLDGFLGHGASAPGDGRVVSLKAYRARRKARAENGTASRGRRILRPVFSSAYHRDVETLLQVLRAEGMNPMMVTQNRSGSKNAHFYLVMLPEGEVERAKPLIALYGADSAKKPS